MPVNLLSVFSEINEISFPKTSAQITPFALNVTNSIQRNYQDNYKSEAGDSLNE